MFIKDIKDLPTPEKLPEDIGDVEPREPIVREYFGRASHNSGNIIYLKQNLISLDRQGVRGNCNIFVLFEKKGNVLHTLYKDFFKETKIDYKDFATITAKVWKEPYNYIVFHISKK